MNHHSLLAPQPPDELLDRFLALEPAARTEIFCTVTEAATLAAVGTRTVQRWIEVGEVDAVLVGPRYWLRRESLLAYLRSRALKDL